MNRTAALGLAREGRLYPSVILYGAGEEGRRATALELARTLLCQEEPAARPCGVCRHCRRIAWPEGEESSAFHPDFHVLLRDLKTATSAEATRACLRAAQVSPFEARGQVFVIASAETLSGEAADSLLKTLEEPHVSAPRHFLLLAPSRLDLSATLRSRSLSLYLGPAEDVDPAEIGDLAASFGRLLGALGGSPGLAALACAGEARKALGGWEDPRQGRPWSTTAAALVEVATHSLAVDRLPRRCLALADALLRAPSLRLRGIPAERILDGLFSRHLTAR
ncbi:MAG TPA: hypothetical protein VF017_13285 [Thermoanaerobaculia bacterium]|nr:hypothetical protein [Thermoanaerobaculia bacterium]